MTFVAEMSFYVKQLNRTITGRDSGSNKQTASKSCALSIVRQLFHLGVIEAFTGTLKKDKSGVQMNPFDVQISPELQAQIKDCLECLNISPNDVKPTEDGQPVSLLSNQILHEFQAAKPTAAGVVPWSPPQQNWNPWTGCNIDEGPLANANLDQVSEDMLEESKQSMNHNEHLQKSVQERQELPVFTMKRQIMEAINDNPVIIIKGNTGCGKYQWVI
jgi:ATP-dependent RNA helicase A